MSEIKTINLSYEQALEKEKEFLEGISYTKWDKSSTGSAIGSYESYLGCVYKVVKEPTVDNRFGKYAPPMTHTYALNPFTCIRLLHELFMSEKVYVLVHTSGCDKAGQIWVWDLEPEDRKSFCQLAYGDNTYARVNIHGVGERMVNIAFAGLVEAFDLGELNEFLVD